MQQEDIQKLKKPFSPPANNSQEVETLFSQRIGIDVPAIRELYKEIAKDLVGEPIFGIGWWAPHLGETRRILAGHYLLNCVQSIGTNLIEAKLHHLEARDYLQKYSDSFADIISKDSTGRPRIKISPRNTAEEDLPHRLANLHIVGFFRALVGALDCFGASIIGVLALESDLRYADLYKAKIALDKASHPIQVNFLSMFKKAIIDSGPAGWIEWLIDYRNMVVHRGRRVSMNQLRQRSPQILGPDGQPIPRSEIIVHLLSEPHLSEVEAVLESTNDLGSERPPILTESVDQTMRGTLDSSLGLMRSAGGTLVDSWKARRRNPGSLPQPEKCWPRGRVRKVTGFPGYDPGRLPYNPSGMIGGLDVVRLQQTAALDDCHRIRWRTFN